MHGVFVFMLGKALVAYNKAPTKEEVERLKGYGDKIKLVDFSFKRSHVVRFCEGKEGKTFHRLLFIGMMICGTEFVAWA